MPTEIAFEKYTLSNGLDVILHEDHAIPFTAVNVWYHVGSQNEEPDRTGFAHLFEHIMFKGSKHHNREYFMPLQEVGANVNGSTSNDRTNYYENVPSEYLELALWLESDRMGFLLDALDEASFATEREVVKNERRQSYENRPYGMAGLEISKALYPPNHPYHWQVIGSQEHLDAASVEDVKAFFRRFYAPNNASLSIAGDIDVTEAKQLVEKYFGSLAPAPSIARIERWVPQLDSEIRINLEDRVQLHRLYFTWVGPPRFDPDEAGLDVLMSILGQGRSSRFYQALVYEKQIARDASASFGSMEIAGEIEMDVTVAPTANLEDAERALLAEVQRLKDAPPSVEELQRAINRLEARHIRQIESVGGFGGRANLLNFYNVFAGDPGLVNRDFDRYLAVTPEEVSRVARQYLGDGRVRLVVSPKVEVAPTKIELDRNLQPGPGTRHGFRPPVPRRLRLSNGMDLLTFEKRQIPMLAGAIYFRGGAVNDPAGREGLASLTTRLLTEGTRNRSSVQIAEESDFIAARLNTSVDRENFVVATEVLTRHWDRALDLMTDVLRNPTFPEREVERIRRERLTDLRRLRDDPNAIAERVRNGVMYGRESAQGHPIGGREASIASISREEIIGQHERAFLRARPTILLAGDLDPETIAARIEAAFVGWADTGDDGHDPTPGQMEARETGTTIYLVDKPGAAQSVISVGQRSVARTDPDYLPLTIMNMAFGGQFTARLNMNLREDKGYTYGYRSGFDWRLSGSSFTAGGSVQTAVTKEALIETLKEFRELHGERPLTAEEIEKARLGLIRGYPPGFETPGQLVGRLMDLVHFGLEDDYYATQIDRLEAVTLNDVRRVATERIHPDAQSIVVVGDRAIIEPGLAELDLPIVHLNHEGEVIP